MAYVGAWLSNLIVPQNPVKATVVGAVTAWELEQGPNFARDIPRVEAGEIGVGASVRPAPMPMPNSVSSTRVASAM